MSLSLKKKKSLGDLAFAAAPTTREFPRSETGEVQVRGPNVRGFFFIADDFGVWDGGKWIGFGAAAEYLTFQAAMLEARHAKAQRVPQTSLPLPVRIRARTKAHPTDPLPKAATLQGELHAGRQAELGVFPIISLWQPWSNWVALGWKTIETRTHSRFKGLVGQRVGIHSALKWDDHAIDVASPYLTDDQILETKSFLRLGGAVICTAFVDDFRFLEPGDAPAALIECDTFRTGLFLRDVEIMPLVCMRGRQGIWKASLSQAREQGPSGAELQSKAA